MAKIKNEIEVQTQLEETQIPETIENPYLNGDQINQFKPYENYFKNIFYYQTIGVTDHEVEKSLEEIFSNVTGRNLQSWACATCRKSNWYKLAKLYFDSINHINTVEQATCQDQDITV